MEFDQLYEQHVGAMIGQVAVLTGDVGAAQDAVQEAWIKAWLRWNKVSAYDNPVAWIRRVAMNTAVSRWRRTRRIVGLATPLAEREVEDERTPDTAALVDLKRALADLPVISRRVVVLHYLVGLSVDEIAAELGIPAGTVKSRLSRSRDRLASYLTVNQEPNHV